MTPSKKLHELIKSLTKAEKRSFKILYTSKKQSEETNFIRLFDFIEKMDVYNEVEVKTHFKGELFITPLTATKYYLYQLIIKSLIYSRNIQSNYNNIYSLQVIPILFRKKLYTHILHIIKIVKKKAYQAENYFLVLEAVKWEETTIGHLPIFRGAYKKQVELMAEKIELLKQISNLAIYANMKARVFALIKDDRFFIKNDSFINFQKEFNQLVLTNPPSSIKSKCDQFYVLGTLSYYSSDFKESKKNYKAILIFLNKHSFLLDEPHNMEYLPSAQNYLVAAIQEGTFDKYDVLLIEWLKKMHVDNIANYMMVVRLELSFLVKKGMYENAILLIDKNAKYESELIQNDFYVVYGYWFDTLLSYFWNENYKKAIAVITKITTFNTNLLPFDLLVMIRFIEILIHFKLNDGDLVDLQVKSLLKLSQRKMVNFPINDTLLKLLPHIVKATTDKKKKKYQLKFLEEMKSSKTEKMLIKLQEYIDFKKWVHSNK